MKVSELAGANLDYWVAKAEGLGGEFPIGTHPKGGSRAVYIKSPDGYDYFFAPSRNWAQGGPIIEREHIETVNKAGIWYASKGMASGELWEACSIKLLEAAMRVRVASSYGDEVPEFQI